MNDELLRKMLAAQDRMIINSTRAAIDANLDKISDNVTAQIMAKVSPLVEEKMEETASRIACAAVLKATGESLDDNTGCTRVRRAVQAMIRLNEKNTIFGNAIIISLTSGTIATIISLLVKLKGK